MALNPAADPSGNFDLSNWKITLPVDQSGTIIGTAQEIKSLSGYQDLNYFYTGSDGAVGRMVVGQIHGQDAELTRLYWDNGTVYFVNDHAGSTGQEAAFR